MRQNEERQERFFKNLASEQAQNNVVLLQSLQNHFAPTQPNPNLVSTGTGGWQGPSTHPYHTQQYHNSHPQVSTNHGTRLWNSISQP